MLQDTDLDAAVAEGSITAAQAATLRELAQRRERERAVALGHEERFRFLRGFNDVFFAIGVVLFVVGLASSSRHAAPPATSSRPRWCGRWRRSSWRACGLLCPASCWRSRSWRSCSPPRCGCRPRAGSAPASSCGRHGAQRAPGPAVLPRRAALLRRAGAGAGGCRGGVLLALQAAVRPAAAGREPDGRGAGGGELPPARRHRVG